MMAPKLKTLLRKADERSIASVCHRIGALLSEFSSTDCTNHFRHAGYASVQYQRHGAVTRAEAATAARREPGESQGNRSSPPGG